LSQTSLPERPPARAAVLGAHLLELDRQVGEEAPHVGVVLVVDLGPQGPPFAGLQLANFQPLKRAKHLIGALLPEQLDRVDAVVFFGCQKARDKNPQRGPWLFAGLAVF